MTWPRAGGLAVLLAATLFFAMKTVGVRFLRFRCRKTALIVFLTCCGLAHGESAADLATRDYIAPTAIVTTFGAAAIFGPRLRKRLPELLKVLRDAFASMLAPRAQLCYVASEPRIRMSFVPRVRTSPPRGPPR